MCGISHILPMCLGFLEVLWLLNRKMSVDVATELSLDVKLCRVCILCYRMIDVNENGRNTFQLVCKKN